jgi:AGZA family xanthine/uracil permease-like MFS transporter
MIDAISQAPPQVLEVGNLGSPAVLLAVIGFIIMGVLMVLEIKGAIFLDIMTTMLLGIPMGITQIPENITASSISLSATFFELDLVGLFQLQEGTSFFHLIITLLTIVISFSLVDLFDTIGTLLGTADKGGFLDEEGKLPRMQKALFSDAAATTIGSMLGTSTVTTYIESGTGVAVGGKTGLTAVVVAVLFLLSIFLTPIAGIIPGAATAPALIMVGVLMVSSLKRIHLDNLEEAIPAFATFALMPFTYSIANGIAGGIIFFVVIKLAKGKSREVHPILYFLAALFVLRFALV